MHASAWGTAARGGSGEAIGVDLPAARLMKIRELQLRAKKPTALVPFYRDTLGLPVVAENERSATFQAGGTRMVFSRAAERTEPYYHVAFNIPENKIERAIEWARDRFPLIHFPGVGEPIVHVENINAHSIYFWDPLGNLLEFIARHEMSNATEGSFCDGEILCCSEIGLVVDDVHATVIGLGERMGLGVYPATRVRSDAFSVVGSATGTPIIVRRDRIWLMTEDLPAAVCPTEVALVGPRRGKLRMTGFPYTIRSD